MKSKLLLIFSLFVVYFTICSYSYSRAISNDLEENLFRLRIIANSNSQEDQILKLKIRNNILNYLNQFNFSNKQETLSYLESHQSDIEQIISKTISDNGFNYSFNYELANSFYPLKQYKNITLPSGYYDGLQIRIGKGEGKNWWCILFPPMCLIDSSTCQIEENSEMLSNNLYNESSNLIHANQPKYKLKFKIIEIFNNL